MQTLLVCLSRFFKAFCLVISFVKTALKFPPASASLYIKPSIFVNGQWLKVIEKSTSLGISINICGTLDYKIPARVKKATDSFEALKDRVVRKENTFVCRRPVAFLRDTGCVKKTRLYAVERCNQSGLRWIFGINWIAYTWDTGIHKRLAQSVSKRTFIDTRQAILFALTTAEYPSKSSTLCCSLALDPSMEQGQALPFRYLSICFYKYLFQCLLFAVTHTACLRTYKISVKGK